MKKIRLFIALVAIVLLAFLSGAVFLSYKVANDITNVISSNVIAIADESTSKIIRQLFSSYNQSIDSIANNPQTIKLLKGETLTEKDKESMDILLSHAKRISLYGSSILVFDKDGNFLASSDNDYAEYYGSGYVSSDEIFTGSNPLEVKLTRQGRDAEDYSGKYAYARQIVSNGKAIGVVYMLVDQKELVNTIESVGIVSSFVTSIIVNEAGEVLIQPKNFNLDILSIKDIKTVKNSTSNFSFGLGNIFNNKDDNKTKMTDSTYTIDNKNYYIHWQKIEGSNLSIVTLTPHSTYAEMFADLIKGVSIMIALVAIFMIVGFIYAIYLLYVQLEKTRKDFLAEQDALHALLNSFPDPIAWLDSDYKYLGVNSLFSKFALNDSTIPPEFIIGKTDVELNRPAEISNALIELYKRVDNGEFVKEEFCVPITQDDGSVMDSYVEVLFKPFVIESKNFKGIIGMGRDVTVRKQMELQLIKARNDATAASKAKSEFLARMSHEIRTPLNGVIGMTNIAINENTSQSVGQYLQVISLSANNLLNIINDLLDFSKIEAGKMTIEKVPFAVHDSMNSIKDLMDVNAKRNNVELIFEIAEDVPEVLVGDALRTGQVIINVMSNAIKFSKDGKVKVSIKLDMRNDNDVVLFFTVQDTGVGIPPEQVQKLFTAFTQADESVSRNFGGTGLGLAICKSLVEMMGGKIWLESEVGVGTTVFFTIIYGVDESCTVEELAQDSSKSNSLDDDIELVNLTKGKRMLIVDDNAINRQILELMLAPLKCHIDKADDGVHAVEAIRNNDEYDIVFMDIQMPRMNGLDATREVRKIENWSKKTTPIIAVTANAMSDDIAECLSAGMDFHVGKPFQINAIKKVIKEFIRQ